MKAVFFAEVLDGGGATIRIGLPYAGFLLNERKRKEAFEFLEYQK